MTKVRDLKVGDLIRADWLGSDWHKVINVGPDWSGSGRIYLAIEGYGSNTFYPDVEVERK